MSSERQLQRQIDKLRLSPLLIPSRVPVLLSDSKGFNLKQQVCIIISQTDYGVHFI